VLECRGLKEMDLVGENDVFVAVHIDGEVLKTSVVDGGGAAPRWNRGSGQELLFTPNVGDPQTMLVRAFDQDKGKDELIGTLASTLGEHSYDEDWSFCDWYGLHDAEGRQARFVYFCAGQCRHPPEKGWSWRGAENGICRPP
jgi:hypothetical protein